MTSNTHKLLSGILALSIVVAAIFSMGLIKFTQHIYPTK